MTCSYEGLSYDWDAAEAAPAAVPDPFLHEDLLGLSERALRWSPELVDASRCGAGALDDPELSGLVWWVEASVAGCFGLWEHGDEGLEEGRW